MNLNKLHFFMFYCELRIGTQASFHASALDIPNIHTWCSLCFDKSSCWCSSCKFDIHTNVVDACLIFILCSFYICSNDSLVFILIHTSPYPLFMLDIFNLGIVGVLKHALQLTFSFLFFFVHIVPFFALFPLINVHQSQTYC